MLKVLSNNKIDNTAWSALVQQSATGTWFQTQETYEFYASFPELFKPFVVAIEQENELRGVCVGYVTVERSALKQFFTRRAIILGGPVLADDCTDEEAEALMKAVRDKLSFTHSLIHSFIHSPIYIETRNFNDYSRWKGAFTAAGFEYRPHLNFHVDCRDKDTMDAKLSESRKRQIKKALKNGVDISEAKSEREITEWYNILADLYKTKVKTPLFPLSFFCEFYRKGMGKYLLVKYEGRVIGGIMCPVLDGKCIYEWFVCGEDVRNKNQYPSVMATYAAMEYGNANGIERFDFMGAGQPNEPYGVREFKARFGGKEVEYGRFILVAKPLLYKLGALGVKLLKR